MGIMDRQMNKIHVPVEQDPRFRLVCLRSAESPEDQRALALSCRQLIRLSEYLKTHKTGDTDK